MDVLDSSEWELVLKGLKAKKDELGQKKENLRSAMSVVGSKQKELLLREFQLIGQEEAACSRLYSKIDALKSEGWVG